MNTKGWSGFTETELANARAEVIRAEDEGATCACGLPISECVDQDDGIIDLTGDSGDHLIHFFGALQDAAREAEIKENTERRAVIVENLVQTSKVLGELALLVASMADETFGSSIDA
jgi:hypothetical protein